MSLFLILLAAGSSKRLKSNIPKPYQVVNNKTILEHSFDAFKNIKEIKKTVIVYNKKHKKYLNKLKIKNTIKITGGKTRQQSTLKALVKIKNSNCEKVLIHDCARPNPSKLLIKNVISRLKKNHAIIPVIKVSDATKRINRKTIFKNIERNSLRLSQTPQGFTFKKIYLKHLKNKTNYFDDDASMFVFDKEKVIVVQGSKNNLKITDREDLNIFKSLNKGKYYFGIGFDVHRLVPKRKLYLSGLKIKSKLGTLGHSDGDPVLHAIIDSILGACRMGDIGEKFSDKDKKFKNIRSSILLKEVMNQIKTKGYFINNIDINIITQTPKIKKYKNKMIECVSKICEISKNQINIKGKTTEKLGVIGKEKAIACEVISSVIKYD
jgi:2-C-methyl-D-erythritol 4-phosphate cytidylyltransferase / 2-C-methyl-D-erythritol 2,4-cyclodiphosphate synthase